MKRIILSLAICLSMAGGSGRNPLAASEVVDLRESLQRALAATVTVHAEAVTQQAESARHLSEERLRTPILSRVPYIRKTGDTSGMGLPDGAPEVSTYILNPSGQPIQLALSSERNPVCGTLVSADGLIVCPKPPKGSVTVTLADGRQLPAKTVVRDEATGLVLLKVDATELPFVQLSSDQLELGQPVAAAGRVASGATVGVGIVTRLLHWNQHLQKNQIVSSVAWHHDAGGAPLVDEHGLLVGVQMVPEALKIGYGVTESLAFPVADVQRLLEVVPSTGETTLKRGRAGIMLADDATVMRVGAGTPAESAGIESGDIVELVGGVAVATPHQVVGAMNRFRAGNSVEITVRRGDAAHQLTVNLEAVESSSDEDPVPHPRITVEQAPAYHDDPSIGRPKPLATAPQAPVHVPLGLPGSGIQPQFQVQRSNLEESIRNLQREIEELRAELKEARDD